MAETALRGATVVLGVSGGIAAYKSVEVLRRLVDAGAHVVPVLTEGALRFVGLPTFSALASERARTSLFDDADPIPHTTLGQRADLVVVAPATARLIGSYAAGISSDLLVATLLATRAPVLVCPAMHTEMWEHASVQENLATLRRRGVHVLEPDQGRLAGGDEGTGRLPSPQRIVEAAAEVLAARAPGATTPAGPGAAGDLSGVRVLVTAGGTREPIDPVRFIGNRSSGKQGYAIAQAAADRGASVTLVSTVALDPPASAAVVPVETASEMADAVLSRAADHDVIVMAAAVADFRPKAPADEKLKKSQGVPEVVLEPTLDILTELGRRKRPGQVLVGFAAETGAVAGRAAAKLEEKRADVLVGNDVGAKGVGFEWDTNAVTVVTRAGSAEIPLTTKRKIADAVLDAVIGQLRLSRVGQPDDQGVPET
ncbi:MAG: bifunctional phosphopantothenoylcysteine decarboxylase/phosphopantothenate--cysteine ligase CoaBC [Acidimicrobiales bacterium]|jgi:phosphopantothenoylcysteine decarboxylase/phosphopantothenate--cysteine ligase